MLEEIGTAKFDPDVDSSLLPRHLANCLNDVSANAVEIRGNRVTFEGGMFRFVTNWNVLVPFGFGNLIVNQETYEVQYSLSYRQSAISSLVAFCVATILAFALPGSRGVSKWMIFFPVLWFLATFVNLMIGVSRFEGFLERCITAAPRTAGRSA